MKKHRGSFLDVTRKPWDKAKQFGMAVELIRHILEEDPSPGDKEDSETMSVVSPIPRPALRYSSERFARMDAVDFAGWTSPKFLKLSKWHLDLPVWKNLQSCMR
jgi:hypothetical protein